jgi:O-antigen/teichoic acid export membrane protein
MRGLYTKGLGILFLTSLPLVLAGVLLAPWLVEWLFGQQYSASIPAVKIAFLSLSLFFVNALPGNVILNSKKIKNFIPWALSNLAVGVVLNLLLIPSLSFVGSAWAKVGSEAYGLIINNIFVFRILNEKA